MIIIVLVSLQSADSVAVGDSKKVDLTRNSELKKLQFFGAGPKTALPDAQVIFAGKKVIFSFTIKNIRAGLQDNYLLVIDTKLILN